MKLKINNTFEKIITPLRKYEYEGLKNKIIKEGLNTDSYEKIKTWNDYIVDGHHRKKICDELKIEIKDKDIDTELLKDMNRKEVERWIKNNQLDKRNISNFDRCVLALSMKDDISIEMKKHMSDTGKGLLISKDLQSTTYDNIGKIAGVGQELIRKVEKLLEYDNFSEEIKETIRDHKKTINGAYQDMLNETKGTKFKEKDFPKGKYQVIYADPPWQYRARIKSPGTADVHYPVMSIEDIKKYKDSNGKSFKDLPDKNCVLFLWVTNPLLEEAFEILNEWGFKYKTNFAWIKDKATFGKLSFYVKGQHELLLICTKGSMTPHGEKPNSVIYGERTKHSKKPENVYEIIESMYPDAKYVELFARNTKEGWDSWGYEI